MKAQAQILVGLPPEPVFVFVAEEFLRNYPRWSPEVRRLDLLTPGPLRVGSRARQVRVDQGRRSESTFRVVALEPPSRVGFAEVSGQFGIEYQMDALGGGAGCRTRLTFAFELRRIELYMRPFEKRIRSAVQEGAERVVRNIKGLLERETAPTLRVRA
ncbi:MAG: SRPBCC family protein [Bdellovibrio bacteriovorus]